MTDKEPVLNYIIMADIIKSSDYEGLALQEEFRDMVEYTNKQFHKSLLSPLTITLGDEFQGIVKNLKHGIDIIFSIEEYLLQYSSNFALRYIINYGKIDTPINSEIAYGMLGDGLSYARKMLENIKKRDMKFEIETGKHSKNKALNDAFLIFQNITAKWKSIDDKKMASWFIQYHDYKVISAKTGITRSQIWKKERSLNISSYFAIKNVITYLS